MIRDIEVTRLQYPTFNKLHFGTSWWAEKEKKTQLFKNRFWPVFSIKLDLAVGDVVQVFSQVHLSTDTYPKAATAAAMQLRKSNGTFNEEMAYMPGEPLSMYAVENLKPRAMDEDNDGKKDVDPIGVYLTVTKSAVFKVKDTRDTLQNCITLWAWVRSFGAAETDFIKLGHLGSSDYAQMDVTHFKREPLISGSVADLNLNIR